MNKEFIPYEQALALKELGFDEPCLKLWEKTMMFTILVDPSEFKKVVSERYVSAPTYSQAFRWLYQKLDIEKGLMPLDTEPQQLLLKELIDKVSSKHLLV
jgi:hypothetical protein